MYYYSSSKDIPPTLPCDEAELPHLFDSISSTSIPPTRHEKSLTGKATACTCIRARFPSHNGPNLRLAINEKTRKRGIYNTFAYTYMYCTVPSNHRFPHIQTLPWRRSQQQHHQPSSQRQATAALTTAFNTAGVKSPHEENHTQKKNRDRRTRSGWNGKKNTPLAYTTCTQPKPWLSPTSLHLHLTLPVSAQP